LELWGGHEPTVSRVRDKYSDQSILAGHHRREDDLERFAALGIKALRYPVLWETLWSADGESPHWGRCDARLQTMRALKLRPIIGLLHHGSGPRHTSLADDAFAYGLAQHAAATARRYSWVEDWIPVNEPLTTARFSAQYGLWYPHARDEREFWRALINQIDGVRLSMRAIRSVNSSARLIQTEDLGRTYATTTLADQAEFDNTRRWMTWDLLCGCVDADHPFWPRLCGFGFGDRLREILDDPCPPDVLGLNHYVTSDRFLDHRVERYPELRHGGNHERRYADIEAVRVVQPGPDLIAGALDETWRRYRRPIAVTEVHLGCTREEQMRWFQEVWSAATWAKEAGADVRAVTAWALLGAYNWRNLLTHDDGSYEAGAFDVRGTRPRPTALAGLLGEIGTTGRTQDALALGNGWWRRDIRLQFEPAFRSVQSPEPRGCFRASAAPSRPLLILGATGVLGQAFARACEWRGLDYVLTDRARLSLDDDLSISAALATRQPWAVVNAAGFVRVDDAEDEAAACRAANTTGALRLASACASQDVPLLSFSSDLVFDGRTGRPLVETDLPQPLSIYGHSKAELERGLNKLRGRFLTVRTAAFFSPFDSHNFAAAVLDHLRRGADFWCADDLTISPTYVPDLVDAALDLLIDGEVGLWHLANRGETTWARFAEDVASACGLDAGGVRGAPWRTLGYRAQRPSHVPLASERGALMPALADAIARFARSAAEEAHSRPDLRGIRRRRTEVDGTLSNAAEDRGRREIGLVAK
jgi:dTDP-4-dehydrorhamnose reductase